MESDMLKLLIKQLEKQGLGEMIPAHNPWDAGLQGMEQIELPEALKLELRRKAIEKMINNIKSMAYVNPLVNKTVGTPME